MRAAGRLGVQGPARSCHPRVVHGCLLPALDPEMGAAVRGRTGGVAGHRGEPAMTAEDLEQLATAAYLLGRDEESFALWERAHHESLDLDDIVRAARCARWLALGLLLRGDVARGGGWLARAHRLLDDRDIDS